MLKKDETPEAKPDFGIIQKLGGYAETRDKLSAVGYDVTLQAMYMWKKPHRNITGEAVIKMMEIAEKEKIDYTSADFVMS